MKSWPYPRWIAHRGAGQLAPENTLAALRRGASFGYRMFECDAKLSVDSEVFLLHDATLERTTNGFGLAGEFTWQELALLDAGRWHSSEYAGEPLPRLVDVARLCQAQGYVLNIEIKPTPGEECHTGEVVAREAARLWSGHITQPLLTSFSIEALGAARMAAPELPRGLLMDTWWNGWFEQAHALGCAAVVCNWTLCNATTVAQVHDAGMRCLSYTVNEASVAQGLVNMGVDGIITDRVDQFIPD